MPTVFSKGIDFHQILFKDTQRKVSNQFEISSFLALS